MTTAPNQRQPGWKKVIFWVIDCFRSCFAGGDRKPEEPIRKLVFKHVAEVLAQRVQAALPEIESALQKPVDQDQDSPSLEALRRIDCEIVKQSPTHCQCTVIVKLVFDGDELLKKVGHEVPWEGLPQSVRADFIRTGRKTQSFVVIERQVKTTPSLEKPK